MKGYKGFEKGLVCRGKQYAENTAFEEEESVICKSGMHFCENPFDVLDFYGFVNDNGELNEFAEVEALDEPKTDDHKKFTTKKLKVGANLGISGLVNAFVDFTFKKIDFSKTTSTSTGDYLASTNTGDYSASTNTGYKSASINTGYGSASTNTGYGSASTNTGYRSASTNTGYGSASTNTGDYSASTNTGYGSASTNTGYRSASTNTGDYSASTVEGKESFAIATGIRGKAKGKLGCYIAVAEWVETFDGWKLRNFKAHKVDGKTIKEDTYYMLKDGKFVEMI